MPSSKTNTRRPPTVEMTQRIAVVLKAMADPVRLRILYQLQLSEKSVNELVGEVGCSQANVSKHLSVLRTAGLIRCETSGTTHYYAISDPIVGSVCNSVCDSIERRLREDRLPD